MTRDHREYHFLNEPLIFCFREEKEKSEEAQLWEPHPHRRPCEWLFTACTAILSIPGTGWETGSRWDNLTPKPGEVKEKINGRGN